MCAAADSGGYLTLFGFGSSEAYSVSSVTDYTCQGVVCVCVCGGGGGWDDLSTPQMKFKCGAYLTNFHPLGDF